MKISTIKIKCDNSGYVTFSDASAKTFDTFHVEKKGGVMNVTLDGSSFTVDDSDTITINDSDFTGQADILNELLEQYETECSGNDGSPGTIYEKYIATISQQTTSHTSGLLVIGRKYIIAVVEGSDDFSNVGYVSNGVEFTATGTAPDEWISGTIVVETVASAPVPVVLENTLSGIPIWSYGDTGVYYLTLSGAFPQDKTFVLCSGGDSTAPCTFQLVRGNNNFLQLVITEGGTRIDGLLTVITPGSVEVRIYS